MTNKWTPGPWTAANGFVHQSDEQRAACVERVPNWCEIIGGNYPMPEGFSVSGHCGLANAQLIGAAPELYEALDTLLAAEIAVGDEPDSNLAWSKMHIARDRATAALAKARGET